MKVKCLKLAAEGKQVPVFNITPPGCKTAITFACGVPKDSTYAKVYVRSADLAAFEADEDLCQTFNTFSGNLVSAYKSYAQMRPDTRRNVVRNVLQSDFYKYFADVAGPGPSVAELLACSGSAV